MTDSNKNNEQKQNKKAYSPDGGTGMLSVCFFVIVMLAIMLAIAHFQG